MFLFMLMYRLLKANLAYCPVMYDLYNVVSSILFGRQIPQLCPSTEMGRQGTTLRVVIPTNARTFIYFPTFFILAVRTSHVLLGWSRASQSPTAVTECPSARIGATRSRRTAYYTEPSKTTQFRWKITSVFRNFRWSTIASGFVKKEEIEAISFSLCGYPQVLNCWDDHPKAKREV
jgi:hypothetical protein